MDKYTPKHIKICTERKKHLWNPLSTMGLIYGPSGCGKTCELEKMSSKGLKVFVIDCDKGGQVGKKICANSASSYEDVCDIIFSIPVGAFDIIAIDSVDILCDTFVRQRLQDITEKDYPGDIPFGKGWAIEKTLFKMLIASILTKKSHILCIGHSSFKENINVLTKKTATCVSPNLRGKMFNTVADSCQYVIYMKLSGKARIPIVQAQETILAKDRTNLFPADCPDVSFGSKEEFALTNVFLNRFKEIKSDI